MPPKLPLKSVFSISGRLIVPEPRPNCNCLRLSIPSLKSVIAAAVRPPAKGGHCSAAAWARMPQKFVAASPTKTALVKLALKMPTSVVNAPNPAWKTGLSSPPTRVAPMRTTTSGFTESGASLKTSLERIWNDWTGLPSMVWAKKPRRFCVILKAPPKVKSRIATSAPPIEKLPSLYFSLLNSKTRVVSFGSNEGTLGLSAVRTFTVAASKAAGMVPFLGVKTIPATSQISPVPVFWNLKPSTPPVALPLSSIVRRRLIWIGLALSSGSTSFNSIGSTTLNLRAVRSNS